MGRYRWSNWMHEESGTPSGDQQFIGIDEKTEDPALLQPGYVRAATNCRIVNGNLGTRGGITYISSYNPVIYGTIYGRGYYVDQANGVSWLMVAVSSGVWFVADGYNPKFVGLPSGNIISGPVDLVTAYNVVVLFQGPGVTPLYWDGVWTDKFGTLPGPVGGKISIPAASTGEFISDRIVVPYNIDEIAVSDIGSYYSYSSNFNDFNINQGEGDTLVRCIEWYRGSAMFLKTKSIYLAQNFSGDLSTMILNRIARGVGLVGRKAVVLVGNDFFFMSPGGVYRMNQIFEDTPEVRALPLSEPLYDTMKRINWQYGAEIIAQARKDRVYFAVPLDQSTRNNALLVWNIVREAWESIDTFPNTPNFGIEDIVEMPYNGERRLFAMDYVNGAIYLMEDESNVDLFGMGPNSTTQIYTYILSRGYPGPAIRANYRHLKLGLATWSPNYSVNCYSSGVGAEQVLATNVQKPNTKYYGFGIPDWNPTNVNNDWGDRGRKDYSVLLPIVIGSGITVDQKQDYTEAYALRIPGKYAQLEVINTQGALELRNVVFESWEDSREDRRGV